MSTDGELFLFNQNSYGGWAFRQVQDDLQESNVYITAMVSMTLQQFPQTTSIATAIHKATTFETAYAYLALIGETTDATVLGNAINYLTSTQLSNGSWEDDPYSTVLA